MTTVDSMFHAIMDRVNSRSTNFFRVDPKTGEEEADFNRCIVKVHDKVDSWLTYGISRSLTSDYGSIKVQRNSEWGPDNMGRWSSYEDRESFEKAIRRIARKAAKYPSHVHPKHFYRQAN